MHPKPISTIDCEYWKYCKKIINTEYNNIYLLDKSLFEIKKEKDIDIAKEIVIDILTKNKTLHEYFSNLN